MRDNTPRDLFGSAASSSSGQYWTVEDLMAAVERWYGVVYKSRSSYLKLFERCRFSYQRPDRVYKSRRESQVVAFQEHLEKNS